VGALLERVLDFRRAVIGVAAALDDEPQADAKSVSRDAFGEYAPPPGQVGIRAAASGGLCGSDSRYTQGEPPENHQRSVHWG
jgi:hypothetical protein